jgi:hypothetical protein
LTAFRLRIADAAALQDETAVRDESAELQLRAETHGQKMARCAVCVVKRAADLNIVIYKIRLTRERRARPVINFP